MSWEDQGRQRHMWFGHGTAPGKATPAGPDSSITSKSTDDRAVALVHGAIAALPASVRRDAERQHQQGTFQRLREAMAAWIKGTRLDGATFASRLFGREADDPVVQSLRLAALGAATATSQADLRDAAVKLADAIRMVGIGRWPRFVADASERAREPATQAAIEASIQPSNPAPDAIRPVYPVETAIGVAAAGVAGGAGAAARAVGGAILRQVAPAGRPVAEGAPTGGAAAAEKLPGTPASVSKQGGSNAPAMTAAAEKPPISRQKQDGHIAGTPQNRNRIKNKKPTSTFDGSSVDADALTQEAWQKGTLDPKRQDIRNHDFGRRIGTGGYGDGQSRVRVYQDSHGRIHGHPVGREEP